MKRPPRDFYVDNFIPSNAARTADALNQRDIRISAHPCGTGMVRVRDLRRDSPLDPERNPLRFVLLSSEDAARLFGLHFEEPASQDRAGRTTPER